MSTKWHVAVCAVTAACGPSIRSTSQDKPAPHAPPPAAVAIQEFSGVHTITAQEDHFVPCGVRDIGDGWALTFKNERDARFLQHGVARQGYAPITHFLRLRGSLGAPGRYNLGFQRRELLVDSVLDIKETLQPCDTYEDVPDAWAGVRHGGSRIIGVALSDDRSLAAVIDLKRKISVWATDRGELLKEFPADDNGEVNWGSKVPMLFSPDRRLLAVGGADGTVRVWNPLTGTRLLVLARRDTVPGVNDIGLKAMATTRAVAFNKSGSILAAVNGFGTAFWSMRNGQRLKGFEQGSGYSTEMAFIGDSSLLVGADTGLLKIYPRLASAPVSITKTPLRAFGQMVRSPDQQWLAMNVWGDSIVLWSLSDNVLGPILVVPPWFGGGGAIAFSPDSKTVAISGGWAGLYVWDVRTGKPIRSFHKYVGAPRAAWFLADGKSIVSWSIFDDSLRVVRLHPEGSRATSRPAVWGSGQRGAVGTPDTPLGMINGVVRDATQRAVGGAEVSIADGSSPDNAILQRQTTSPGGYFSFFGIKAPHIILRARKPGFETTTRYLHVNGGELGTDLVMKRESALPKN